ncbi:MAG TPA: hypothetical protein GX526_00375 [Thermoanaerobacterales bacterium]|nr:hypothetical protein [Thermoanaerobacterales bacterium]
MNRFLVLALQHYDFKNDSGERVNGAKVTYISPKASSRENEVGYCPLIVNISDSSVVRKFGQVPGIYNMTFEQVTGRNNRPSIILSDVDFINEVDMSAVLPV